MVNSILNFAPTTLAETRWSYEVTNVADRPSVSIRGMIGLSTEFNEYGGDYAGTFREMEAEIEALGDVPEIDLYVSSPGGHVEPAMALHNLIERHPARFIGIVDGMAASAATLPLMACDMVRVPRYGRMMIHFAQTGAFGDYRELEKIAKMLRQENRRIANLYADKITAVTGREDRDAVFDEVMEMMADDTYLTGTECLEMGLCDEVMGESSDPETTNFHPAFLNSLHFPGVPEEVRRLFDSSTQANTATSTATDIMPEPTPINVEASAAPAVVAPAAEPVASAPVAEPAAAPVSNVEPAPAAAPVAPVAPVTNAEPVPAAPVAPAAAAPDLASLIQNAVAGAVAPLNDRLSQIENSQNLAAAGVTASSVITAPPVEAPAGDPHVDASATLPTLNDTSRRQYISAGLKAAREGLGQPKAN